MSSSSSSSSRTHTRTWSTTFPTFSSSSHTHKWTGSSLWIQKYKEMDSKQRKRAVCLNIIAPCAAILLIIALLAWLLWPTDPEFTVVDHHIRDVNKDLFPPTLTFKMDVTVKVRNRSVYTFKYDSLNMTIRHDGNLLAVVEPTNGGGTTIAGKDVSLVNATLDIDMLKIIKHSPSLIADLFTHLGAIPLVMQANVTNPKFGIGVFTPPYKGCGCNVLKPWYFRNKAAHKEHRSYLAGMAAHKKCENVYFTHVNLRIMEAQFSV